MNKKIVFAIFCVILVLPVAAFAQLQDYAEGAPRIDPDIKGLIGKITNLIGLVFGAIAVIAFVMAGIIFLTAQGAPDKITLAKQAVIWGVAGVVVGIVAFSVIAIVSSFLTGGGSGSQDSSTFFYGLSHWL